MNFSLLDISAHLSLQTVVNKKLIVMKCAKLFKNFYTAIIVGQRAYIGLVQTNLYLDLSVTMEPFLVH